MTEDSIATYAAGSFDLGADESDVPGRERHVPLVTMNRSGVEPPIFFVDGDLSGTGAYVRELARHLGPARPFYAVRMPGTNGTPLRESIEEMALATVDLIKSVRPVGPYLVGGFAGGAPLAHAVARRLQQQNDRVLKLIVVEALGENAAIAKIADAVDGFLRTFFASEERRAGFRRAAGRYATLVRRTAGERPGSIAKLRALWQILTKEPAFVTTSGESDEATVWRRLESEYVPRRFYGTIDVLLARDQARAGSSRWDGCSGRVTVETVPGDARTCRDLHIEALARAVDSRLKRA